MQAVEAFEKVKQSVDRQKRKGTDRFPEAASPGDFWRQGDIYVWKVEQIPANLKVIQEKQLAPGETKGSRHILDSLAGVKVFDAGAQDPLAGPWLEVKERATITHPEHRHLELPAGCYHITYQRAYAEERKRVLD